MARTLNYRFGGDLNKAIKNFNGTTISSDTTRAKRLALRAYIRERLPLKFAGRRYNPSYTPNKPEYNRRKQKEGYGTVQLVRTGRAKRTIISSATVVNINSGARLSINAPFYMGRRPGAQIALGRDWLRFNSRDRRFFMRKYKEYLTRIRRKRN